MNCWICFGSEGKLRLSPCSCAIGSAGHVHTDCFNQWLLHSNQLDFSPYKFDLALSEYLSGDDAPHQRRLLSARWHNDDGRVELLEPNFWNTLFALENMTVRCRNCRDYYTDIHTMLFETDRSMGDVLVLTIDSVYQERHDCHWSTLSTALAFVVQYILASIWVVYSADMFTIFCVYAPCAFSMLLYLYWRQNHIEQWHVPVTRHISRGELIFYAKFYHSRFHELAMQGSHLPPVQ